MPDSDYYTTQVAAIAANDLAAAVPIGAVEAKDLSATLAAALAAQAAGAAAGLAIVFGG